MPITSESQRNRVALLIMLNVLIVVGYAFFILSSVASPSPLLIAALIAWLAYNLTELGFSTPSRDAPVPAVKPRTVRRTVHRPAVDQGPAVFAASAPPITPEAPRLLVRRRPAERTDALEKGSTGRGTPLAGKGVDGLPWTGPAVVGAPHDVAPGTRAGQAAREHAEDLPAAAVPSDDESSDQNMTMTMPEAPAERGIPVAEGFAGSGPKQRASDADVEAITPAIPAVEGAARAEDKSPADSLGIARALVGALRRVPQQPTTQQEQEHEQEHEHEPLLAHDQNSALTVEIVEAEFETEQPIADVDELEKILESVEARGEAAATMDALAELGTVALARSEPAVANVPRTPETVPETSALREETRILAPTVGGVTEPEDALPAENFALESPVAPTVEEVAQAQPAPSVATAPADSFAVSQPFRGAGTVQEFPPIEPPAAGEGIAGEGGAAALTNALTDLTTPVIGLGSDLLGEEAPPAPPPAAKGPRGEASPAETAPETSVAHLGGRLREPVDIVIANLQVEPARTPAAALRRRAATATPSIAVPPRAATGLRASSETLAMLRNQLGVGRDRLPDDREAEVLQRQEPLQEHLGPETADGPASSGAARAEDRQPGDDAPAVETPQPPPDAPRRPSLRVSDSSRDRVMFVWQGRYFFAPMEGRDPLRVAQSLYDFMMEEDIDRA